ncbi:ABC transporter permease [Mycoplasmoides genitalium]
MLNLIKNVIRSLKSAKIALIALTFLIFVAVGGFVLLNNTVNNFNAAFNYVTHTGKLSNAIINERYDFGKLEFQEQTNNSQNSSDSFTLTLTNDSRTSFINNALRTNPSLYEGLVTQTFSYQNKTEMTEKTNIVNQSKIIAANNLNNALSKDKQLLVSGQLEKLNAVFREYKAINITDKSVFKKLIVSEPNDLVNSLVIFDGQNLSSSKQSDFNNFLNQFNEIKSKGKDNLSTTLKTGQYQAFLQTLFDYAQASETTLKDQLQKLISNPDSSETNQVKNLFDTPSTLTNIGGQLTLQWTENSLTKQIVIFDPSSYETIVAPGNWTYQQQLGKEVYPDINNWESIKKLPLEQFESEFLKIDQKYKISIDNIDYLVIGVGISPDFVYPVFSASLIVPNIENEQLYYVNQTGYERTFSSFLTNPVETAIVARLINLESDLNTINQWAVENMSWPTNIKAAYSSSDTTNILNLLAARTVFIPNLINTINLVALFLTIAILTVAIIVSILILISYLKKNTEQIGILKANGLSGKKINLSLLIFGLIPAIVGAISGYSFGIGFQDVAIHLFSNYWFIPTATSSFSVVGLLFFSLFVILIMSSISLLVGSIILKKDVVKILKHDSEFKVSRLGLSSKKLFARFGIMTRFRVALAFNAPWKLVFLTLMSSFTMMILNLSFATKDSFENAQSKTNLTNQNHQYEFELASATTQSGLLKWQLFAELGTTDKRSESSVKLANKRMDISNVDASKDWKNQQVINFLSDASGFSNDLNYLENIVQSKIGLDYSLGFNNIVSNPWRLSETLMPTNQASASNTAFQNFLKAIITINPSQGSQFIKQTQDPLTKRFIYAIDSDKALKNNNEQNGSQNHLTLNDDFAKFLYSQFELIKKSGNASNEDLNAIDFENPQTIRDFYNKYNALPPLDYKLSFNVIGLPKETIAGQIDTPKYGFLTLHGEYQNTPIKIKGIKDWKDKVDNLGPVLSDQNNHIINQELFKNYSFDPLIVNNSAAKKYQLAIGSEINIAVNNSFKRIDNKIINQDPLVNATFRVVGINNSAHDPEFFTSYSTAFKVLEYPNEWFVKKLPFNSFYANSLLSFVQSTSLFSESGIFPATSSFSTNNTVLVELIKKTINYKNGQMNQTSSNDSSKKENYQKLQKALGISTDLEISKVNEYVAILARVYNGLPYNSTISFISNVAANNALFGNIANTTKQIQAVVIAVIIPIIMLIILLVSTTLIQELKKIAIRLKALGYSNLKILASFLSIYIPLFAFGLLISIPFSIYLIALHNEVIFASSSIFLDAFLSFESAIGSMLVLLGVLSITFMLNWLELNKIKIDKEIKNS